MKAIQELEFGFIDAENYQRSENRNLFQTLFIRNDFLKALLQRKVFFLIGEKGTGKTAYSVYLANSPAEGVNAEIKFLRDTDYQKFVALRRQKHLELSDYDGVWKVILLLLLAGSVKPEELDQFFTYPTMRALEKAIEEYYHSAFSPEIIAGLTLVEHSQAAARVIGKYIQIGAGKDTSHTLSGASFQVTLAVIQRQLEKALAEVRIRQDRILFIDGIDLRPDLIGYRDYLECVKGLANAAWNLNNGFLASQTQSHGRFRIVLLLRPDIFNSLNLQNLTNKIRDNAVYLDWRTTYPSYRSSRLFKLADNLLAAQQDPHPNFGQAWDHYFPWRSRTTMKSRSFDASFIKFLRLSYSRPRDIVTLLSLAQEVYREQDMTTPSFPESLLNGSDLLNRYSEYLMGSVKDQLAFYYSVEDYSLFLRFFSHLEGRSEFGWDHYQRAFARFRTFAEEDCQSRSRPLPEFVESPEVFLQFLYDTNILCYIETCAPLPPEEDADGAPEAPRLERYFRWCYRERNPSNIAPKVSLRASYRIHYGLCKALNVGFR